MNSLDQRIRQKYLAAREAVLAGHPEAVPEVVAAHYLKLIAVAQQLHKLTEMAFHLRENPDASGAVPRLQQHLLGVIADEHERDFGTTPSWYAQGVRANDPRTVRLLAAARKLLACGGMVDWSVQQELFDEREALLALLEAVHEFESPTP